MSQIVKVITDTYFYMTGLFALYCNAHVLMRFILMLNKWPQFLFFETYKLIFFLNSNYYKTNLHYHNLKMAVVNRYFCGRHKNRSTETTVRHTINFYDFIKFYLSKWALLKLLRYSDVVKIYIFYYNNLERILYLVIFYYLQIDINIVNINMSCLTTVCVLMTFF